ncbi:hypothetical protein [Crucivirus-499]|nr:hypothetical protein [Crucivirus-499]
MTMGSSLDLDLEKDPSLGEGDLRAIDRAREEGDPARPSRLEPREGTAIDDPSSEESLSSSIIDSTTELTPKARSMNSLIGSWGNGNSWPGTSFEVGSMAHDG